jgi:hypothetical protein
MRAPTSSFELPYLDGLLRVSLVHGRVHVALKPRGARVWTTAPLPLDKAEMLSAGVAQLIQRGHAAEPEGF